MAERLLSKRRWSGPLGDGESTAIWCEIKPNGDLALSAQDMGPSVEHVWGTDDYEYGLTIPADALPLLVPDLLATAFSDDPPLTISKLRAICDSHGIDTKFWTWP